MFPKKFLYSSILITIRYNLNVSRACSDHFMIKCLCPFRNASFIKMSNKTNNMVSKVRVLCDYGKLLEMISSRLHLTTKLKQQSTVIIKAWTRQCEYIVAQRFRRTQQMFCLYSRMWEERQLRELLHRMQQQISRRSKEFVFGAIGVSAFNWENNNISDLELIQHTKEFEFLKNLKEKTVICKYCNLKRIIDIMLPDTTYCICQKNTKEDKYVFENWEPFIERKDLLIWRRKYKKSNNYEYKLHGRYDDITGEDFFQVQVDTLYRKQWDTTAVKLFIVDSHQESNSDIIYWEMLWPRMFSNRDYVYNRRYMVDKNRKIITIISRSIQHPSCPKNQDKHRVNDYESCMVIRCKTELNQPGIEFCLTYYDDPGVNIPASVSSWVAISGMPDFLVKLHKATQEYRKLFPENVSEPDIISVTPIPPAEDSEVQEPVSQMSTTTENESSGYWNYIHPYYYMG